MVRLYHVVEHGLDTYQVVWADTVQSPLYRRSYLSEEAARAFVASRWPTLTDTLSLETITHAQRQEIVA
jgi:hypothetical protein